MHRLAVSHGKRLAGRAYKATSPNGRFADGARAIDGRVLSRLEANGKNLFAFFSVVGSPDVVMHVHFGMAGRWSAVDAARARPPTGTTRLQLEGHGLVSQLSAMTVAHGDLELYLSKTKALGEDPLRADADPEALWRRVSASPKTIGALLMDQGYFAGVGNIFRCEILLVAAVHPNLKGSELTREQFDRVWSASVRLMGIAFTLGSIVTVEPHEAAALGNPKLRRWLYNSAQCGRCRGPVVSWQIAARTCYACVSCQPLAGGQPAPLASPVRLFSSNCAPDSLADRLLTPQKLRVPELREELKKRGMDATGSKAQLLGRLVAAGPAPVEWAEGEEPEDLDSLPRGATGPVVLTAGGMSSTPVAPSVGPSEPAELIPAGGAPVVSGRGVMRSARAAAADKAAVNESRAVEHIAEFEVRRGGGAFPPLYVETTPSPFSYVVAGRHALLTLAPAEPPAAPLRPPFSIRSCICRT